jgi:EpsI family protein
MAKKTFWISLLLMVMTIAIVQKMHIGKDIIVWKKNLDKLPYTIGRMSGVDIPLEESVIKELDPDVYVYRNYTSTDGRIINVYIGYYGTQKGGRSAHNPEGCYPGAGWSILGESMTYVPVKLGGVKRNMTLNTLQVKRGDVNQLVYHWYQTERDTVIVNGVQQNINRFKNRLLNNRDDGAFIRISEDNGDSEGKTKKDIEEFIRQLFPLVAQYWPQEKERVQ